jgi:hypothetical protein
MGLRNWEFGIRSASRRIRLQDMKLTDILFLLTE